MISLLVIDDEPDIAECLSEALQDQGHRVSIAHDGQAGLRMLDAHVFDVVLTDLMMPIMDGEELLRRIRSHPRLASVPVIVMSAGLINDEVRSLANVCLIKPFKLPALYDHVTQLVAR